MAGKKEYAHPENQNDIQIDQEDAAPAESGQKTGHDRSDCTAEVVGSHRTADHCGALLSIEQIGDKTQVDRIEQSHPDPH